MKILLNGQINEYTTREVNDLLRRGYQFDYSPSIEAYIPKPVKIHENGESRHTTLEELINRRENGECFLKVAGKPIYAPVEAEKYTRLMRPIWREDRREKREWDCIYKDKTQSCPYQVCDECPHRVYMKESVNFLVDRKSENLPTQDDVADTFARKKAYDEMYRVVRNLDPVDLQILLMKADGKTEREIAKKLNFKSKTSVQKRMAKVLPPLREHLKKFL